MRHLEERLEARRQQLKQQREALRETLHRSPEDLTQQRMDRAKALYREITEQLELVGQLLREQRQTLADGETLKRSFDIMLQATLLRTAVGDDDFSRVERQFIREIAETGDVVDWVNQTYHGKEELTWGKLYYLEEAESAALMDYIADNSRELMEQVFLPLALADRLFQKSRKQAFLDRVEAICQIFTAIDGDGDNQQEAQALRRALDLYFELPIWAAERKAREMEG